MDLASIVRIVFRRWKLVAPILILTLILAAWIYTDDRTEYIASGSQYLVQGRGEGGPDESPDDVVAELLSDLLTQPSVRQQIQSEGLSTSYQIELGATGRTLRLSVRGESAAQVVGTATRLVDLAPEVLVDALGEDGAADITVEQASSESEANATEADDGTFRYTSVLLIGSVTDDVVNSFPASVATIRSLIAISHSIPFHVQFAESHPGAAVVVSEERDAPLFNITVTAPTADRALESYQGVVDILSDELNRLQADLSVDPSVRTQLRTLVPATFAVPTTISKVRPVASIVVLGSGVAVALATLVEALVVDRRRRSDGRSVDVAVDEPEAETSRQSSDPMSSPHGALVSRTNSESEATPPDRESAVSDEPFSSEIDDRRPRQSKPSTRRTRRR